MYEGMNNMMQVIQDLQKRVRDLNVAVTSEDGSVKVVMNGYQELLQVVVSPEVFVKKDASGLATAIAETFDRALKESRKIMQEEIKKVTGGMGFPAIPGFF